MLVPSLHCDIIIAIELFLCVEHRSWELEAWHICTSNIARWCLIVPRLPRPGGQVGGMVAVFCHQTELYEIKFEPSKTTLQSASQSQSAATPTVAIAAGSAII